MNIILKAGQSMCYFSKGLTRDKLAILYFLYITDFELSQSALLSAMVEMTDGDYFRYSTGLAELAQNKLVAMVKRANGESYCIAEQGRFAVKEFLLELPLSLREKIDQFAKMNEQRLLSNSQLSTSVEKVGNGQYMVTLKISEGEMLLFHLDLNVSAKTAASAICTRFEETAPVLYKSVYEILTKGIVLE